jgi:pimeloyl-ACP methyl ester carboxylesterase
MRTTVRIVSAASLILATLTAALSAERWQTLPPPPPMPEPLQSGYAPVNGIRMFYAVFGEGEPILLIHGGLANSDYWANQVIALSKTNRVIVADSRGHGRSSRTKEQIGYDLMASDYIALLDYLKVPKTAIVGWSDGGIIGLDIAIHHPERVTKLFAHGANVTPDGVKSGAASTPAFSAFTAKADGDYKRLSPTPNDYAGFVAEIERMWGREPNWTKAVLAKIATPTVIVLGDHDEAIKRDHTAYMASSIPGAKLIILKDVSHFAMVQDPEGYTAAVLGFLAGP